MHQSGKWPKPEYKDAEQERGHSPILHRHKKVLDENKGVYGRAIRIQRRKDEVYRRVWWKWAWWIYDDVLSTPRGAIISRSAVSKGLISSKSKNYPRAETIRSEIELSLRSTKEEWNVSYMIQQCRRRFQKIRSDSSTWAAQNVIRNGWDEVNRDSAIVVGGNVFRALPNLEMRVSVSKSVDNNSSNGKGRCY